MIIQLSIEGRFYRDFVQHTAEVVEVFLCFQAFGQRFGKGFEFFMVRSVYLQP